MSLKTCENPCSLVNIYARLNKIIESFRRKKLARLLATGRESRNNNDDDDVSKRLLFSSPICGQNKSLRSLSGSVDTLHNSKQSTLIDAIRLLTLKFVNCTSTT